AVVGPLPVPPEQEDPGGTGGARGGRDGRHDEPAGHVPRRLQPTQSRRGSGRQPRGSITSASGCSSSSLPATCSPTASTWASASCCCRWHGTMSSDGPCSTA